MRRINYDAYVRSTEDGPQLGRPSPRDHVKAFQREPRKFEHRFVMGAGRNAKPVKPANSGRKRKPS